MAGISAVTLTENIGTEIVVTLPVGYISGDRVAITTYNNASSKPVPGTFTTDYPIIFSQIKNTMYLRMYSRVMDGTEGATVTIPMDGGSSQHKVYAFILDDIDFASLVTTGYVENKPRIYFPNTIDSGDTAEKLWLMVGGTASNDVHVRVAVNNDAWDFDTTPDPAVNSPGAAIAWKISSTQTFVGSGDFAYWNHTDAFISVNVAILVFDTVAPTPDPEPDPEPEVEASGGASTADLATSRRSRSPGAARRRIVDPLDPRRKWNTQF